ncbi:MAG TPA: hypothetical protein PK102_10800, partial [bacterium]|nr:hypothetical protein [bacterium]
RSSSIYSSSTTSSSADLSDEDLTESEVLTESDEDTNDEDVVIIPESVTIGEGTDAQWMPIGCRYFKYSRSAALYLSSEIGVSAPITKVAWFDNTGAPTNFVPLGKYGETGQSCMV